VRTATPSLPGNNKEAYSPTSIPCTTVESRHSHKKSNYDAAETGPSSHHIHNEGTSKFDNLAKSLHASKACAIYLSHIQQDRFQYEEVKMQDTTRENGVAVEEEQIEIRLRKGNTC
jgi:hypothetical protein